MREKNENHRVLHKLSRQRTTGCSSGKESSPLFELQVERTQIYATEAQLIGEVMTNTLDQRRNSDTSCSSEGESTVLNDFKTSQSNHNVKRRLYV